MRKHQYTILVVVLLLLAVAIFNEATPVPPIDINRLNSSRRQPEPAISVPAQAGNITELLINATVVTKTWQGYYGNVTGRIVLDNSDNMSMYDWSITTPEGEIYTANETITDWSSIKCFDYFATGGELNLSLLETALGCAGDADGVNETFTAKQHPSFYVGTKKISANSCWATRTYVNDGSSTNFYEVLLIAPTENTVVYTTLINASQTNFAGTNSDFQIIVGENGHGTAANTKTPYYFYVEIY